jgi:choline dehydrogenase-like flavoprotein
VPEWDCVVVGGGLIGTLVARRLAEADREVVLVERGEAVSDPPGSHVRNGPPYRDERDAYFGAIDTLLDYLDRDAGAAQLPGAFTTSIDGGMGIVWTNNCPRAVSGVDRPDLLDDARWEECYALAEGYLEVRVDQFDDSARARFVAERLGSHLAGQGRALEPLPLAGYRQGPERIHYVGPADIAASGPDIGRVRGEVERIEIDAARARGVRTDDALVEAEHVVVAGGAVETPALLSRSGVRAPVLGRYLSFHPVLIGQVVLDSSVDAEGSPDPLPRWGIPPTPQRPWFTMLLRDTDPLQPEAGDRDVAEGRLIEFQVFAPVDPEEAKRMAVGDDGEVRFDVPLSTSDEQRRAAIEADVDVLCSRIGRWRAGCEPQWAPLGTPHLIGSCRIGDDPAASVASLSGEVRGVRNLFLAGNGVIPTRLAVNPTLTAAALAINTADAIIEGHD